VIDDLKSLLGDRVSTSGAVREHHSHGESWHAAGLPDCVVFPTSTAEVSAIVKLCARHRTPIVPFGMGSSLEGHVNAIHGGVSIDLTRMTKVLRLNPEDLDITVEAGLTRLKLDAHLKNTGLMFPTPDQLGIDGEDEIAHTGTPRAVRAWTCSTSSASFSGSVVDSMP